MKLRWPKVLREAWLLMPRRGLQAVRIDEAGLTGFGDRLRGVALALYLARRHGVTRIEYRELNAPSDPARAPFPHVLTDLIDLRGLEFIAARDEAGPRTLTVRHDCSRGTALKSRGFADFPRVVPRDAHLLARLAADGVDARCVALHVRGTDALGTARYAEGAHRLQEQALASLEHCAARLATRKVYLASDSAQSLAEWRSRLQALGYQVLTCKQADHDAARLRQTGAQAMLYDFFAMSQCGAMVRLVPSEFSRFAALRAGQPLAYGDKCYVLAGPPAGWA